MIGIIDTLDIFLSDIWAENIPLTPDEKEMSQCIIADWRITDLTDRVANFLITKAREYNGISEVLDLELLQEVLSNDSADSILESPKITLANKKAENSQQNFEWMRTYSRDIEDLDAKCM
jgi:phage protein D